MKAPTKKQLARIKEQLNKCDSCGKPAVCRCKCGFLTCRDVRCYGKHERAWCCPDDNIWSDI